MVAELGSSKAFKQSNDIINFSTYRANIIIDRLSDDADLVEFLRFISSFEFVSIDFVSTIQLLVKKDIAQYLDILTSYNVCEAIGPNGNYFRVSEMVRDAIIRDRFDISEEYIGALRSFVRDFADSYDEDAFDVSEYQIAVREALASDIKIPDRLLIPAHFLQTMRQLYDDRNYKDVVVLADRVLLNRDNYDSHTEQDIRYYLCQSLARLLDGRFLGEVQTIKGPEHDFLLGFFYRLQRRFKDALVRYESAMGHKRTEQRARREIVFVLLTIEDFEGAISLARENFQRYPRNPYLAQAYFNCVIHEHDQAYAKAESQIVLEALRNMGGARATEMLDNLEARFEFEFGTRTEAFKKIDDAILKYPDIIYPLITKLEMATATEDEELLSASIVDLKKGNPSPGHKAAIAKGEAVLAALSGDVDRSIRMLNRELSELSEGAKEKLGRRFKRLASTS